VQLRHYGKWCCVDGLVFPDTVPFLWNVRTHKSSNTASHTRRHNHQQNRCGNLVSHKAQVPNQEVHCLLTAETTCNFGFLYHILDGRYLIQLLTLTVEICHVGWLYDAWLWWDNRQYDFSLGKTWCCQLYFPTISLLFEILPIFHIPFFYMALSI
jgi:hypothetical protein